jgi:glycosyltransferase involved in cell wall biosynthesis
MEKKVILMLIPNLNFGGAQRVFYNLSLELSKKYKVVECVFNFDAGHAFVSGNEVLSLEVAGGKNIVSKLWLFLRRCRKLREIKKKIGADFCISHLEGADLVNVLSKGKEKTITWVHGSKWYDQNITGLLGVIRHQLLIPFAYKNADKVVTVSKAIKEELVNKYGINDKRITTIYNYFDFDTIVTLSNVPLGPKYYPVFQGVPILIFSGRLVLQKNPVALLKWFASFSKGNPGKLVILGDGEMRNELLQLSQLLGLTYYHPWSDQILHGDYQLYFLGFQENPFQFIKNSSVFILPSLWEGFPMALGEAMCCGLPVASADCPTGPMEMITDRVNEKLTYPLFAKFGVLLPLLNKNTFDCWTEGLLTLLNNEAAMKEYSKQSVERGMSFSKSNNTHHVIDLVETAI